jgi:hypothetical protein
MARIYRSIDISISIYIYIYRYISIWVLDVRHLETIRGTKATRGWSFQTLQRATTTTSGWTLWCALLSHMRKKYIYNNLVSQHIFWYFNRIEKWITTMREVLHPLSWRSDTIRTFYPDDPPCVERYPEDPHSTQEGTTPSAAKWWCQCGCKSMMGNRRQCTHALEHDLCILYIYISWVLSICIYMYIYRIDDFLYISSYPREHVTGWIAITVELKWTCRWIFCIKQVRADTNACRRTTGATAKRDIRDG